MEEALGIFQDMVTRGCERNVITYSSLIVAAEKAGRWQLALELLEEMHRDGCSPNAVTFNAILSACAQGAAPHPALPCHPVVRPGHASALHTEGLQCFVTPPTSVRHLAAHGPQARLACCPCSRTRVRLF